MCDYKKQSVICNYNKKTPLRGGIERSRPSSSDCANFYSLTWPLLLSGFVFPILIFYVYRFCIFVYGSPLLVYKSSSFLQRKYYGVGVGGWQKEGKRRKQLACRTTWYRILYNASPLPEMLSTNMSRFHFKREGCGGGEGGGQELK